MHSLRNALAKSFRRLPPFRGKGRLGVAIGRPLVHADDDADSIAKIVMRDGTLMRIDVRSRTEQWAYWTGEYDAQIISRLAACLTESCTVFDVGANVGFYTIALGKKLSKLHGKLHAFEPVRSNFERLVDCVSLNALESTVFAHNIALGDEEGTIELHMESKGNASTGNAVMVKGKVRTENNLMINSTAPITHLDSFVQEWGIDSCDLIKIDVEGAEVMFLRGGSNFLSKQRPIIYGEFNPYWLTQFGYSFLDVASIVTPWDYRFFKQVGLANFTEVMQPTEGLADMLLCPSETPKILLKNLGVIGDTK